ncbi:BglG family transcription antiterminator [Companilactobacillus kedongensis]|uniref:BglG family transcription antiterminator n=1 Tax=Companilactobacillus kedongensis TaxID=2486004 RepID=UPI000F773864|nr:transcription antiterminator [Companilactobacillus kedongensis]
MNLSSRESEISLLLLKNPSGLGIADLMKNIHVSRRTIYRELSSLETSLAHLAISLTKEDGSYRLVGSKENLDELNSMLVQPNKQATISSVETRQSALACKLLTVNEITTIGALAEEFEVSVSTITQDLKVIEGIFNDYQLEISRIKAKGIEIIGKESNVRRVISGILSSEINEYEFFEFLTSDTAIGSITTSQYFINLLDIDLVKQANEAIQSRIKTDFSNFSDSQLKQLIIILAVSAKRIEDKKVISHLNHIDQSNLFKYQHVAIELFNQFSETIRDRISLMELEFMAQQIQGMSFSISNNVLLDDYDLQLSYQVRSLIKQVSDSFGYDFKTDDTLFNDLMAHIGSALKRQISQLPEINNPVLKNVISNYPQLYEKLKDSLKDVFDDRLPSSEAAYVLIHFASAFEQQRQDKIISALVVCANGIGTARVLESRLKKTVPEISNYRVSRVAELSKLDLKQYDLILSTIFLPGFKYPYKVISPLLLQNEIREIKDYLSDQFGAIEVKRGLSISGNSNDPITKLNNLYDELTVAKKLLKHIEVKKIDNRDYNLQQTLLLLSRRLRPEFVSDADKVATALFQRMERAPVGLPNTGVGLVHTTNEAVIEPFFSIYELSNSIVIKGMDHKAMNLKRCFFMLAPREMTDFSADLMGGISSSIIDSESNLKVYQHGNTNELKELVSKLFLDAIKQKDWK